eukprot:TRINITY_DN4155_c1_g1_i9.p2 TRINITY_DN4155_c1_g1~~TRINITY_DN4155_c1_g1_i9.p2  ORF type:complete len:235 (-),score=2.25 TRINITY_DN4155_c1_g1_i9:799-1503(-)
MNIWRKQFIMQMGGVGVSHNILLERVYLIFCMVMYIVLCYFYVQFCLVLMRHFIAKYVSQQVIRMFSQLVRRAGQASDRKVVLVIKITNLGLVCIGQMLLKIFIYTKLRQRLLFALNTKQQYGSNSCSLYQKQLLVVSGFQGIYYFNSTQLSVYFRTELKALNIGSMIQVLLQGFSQLDEVLQNEEQLQIPSRHQLKTSFYKTYDEVCEQSHVSLHCQNLLFSRFQYLLLKVAE